MKIAIRADGGNKIGMGHIMRTLVLAKELAKTNNVFYICRVDNPISDKYKIGIDKVRDTGFYVELIHENNVIEELKNINADMLITDSYDANEFYFDATKKIFEITGCVDDINFLDYYNVDFLINQNFGAEEYSYKVNKNTKLFLGTNYTMLRQEFRNVPKRYIKKDVENIMITVGGADPNGITNIICDYVKDLDLKFHVVVGPSFKEENIGNLIKLKNLKNNINLYFNPNMIEIMNKCDISIAACGSTLYELAACGVPTLGIIIADNQEDIAYKLNDLGVINNSGWYNKLIESNFTQNFNNIAFDFNVRKQMSSKAQNIIDGKGVKRIVESL